MWTRLVPRRGLLATALLLLPLLDPSRAAVAAGDPALTPPERAALLQAAGAPDLDPWQRAIMLETAGGPELPPLAPWPEPDTLGSYAPTPSSADGTWAPFPVPPPDFSPPQGRRTSAAILDPTRHRMVVFGGGATNYLADTWELRLGQDPTWSPVLTEGIPPPPRRLHSMVYDPVRDRMIVFGGYDGGYFNDVWELAFSLAVPKWTRLDPAGTPPAPRADFAMVYDGAGDRVVVFGGHDGVSPPALRRADVWALSLSGTPAWSELLPGPGPTARSGHRAIYDPAGQRMVVFGGYDVGFLDDTWALKLGDTPVWERLTPAGALPAARAGHTMEYDAARHSLVVFGGQSAGGDLGDTWLLPLADPASWVQVPAGGPTARWGHVAAFDPAGDALLVFSGAAGSLVLRDTWTLDFQPSPRWVMLPRPEPQPFRRTTHTAIADPLRHRMIVFGGSNSVFLNEVWALSLGTSPSWDSLVTKGTPPAPRRLHGAVYDPLRDRMVVFGGYDGTLFGDAWALSLSTLEWSPIETTGPRPAPRADFAMIQDPVGDRVIVFGGWDGVSPPALRRADTWALSLADPPAWTQITPAGGPTPRSGQRAIYDPLRARMVVFGGFDLACLNEVWALSLAGAPQWSRLSPGGTAPAGRVDQSVVYDPNRDRMVMFGGYDQQHDYGDVWALGFGPGAWSQLSPGGLAPYPRWGHVAIVDPLVDRMIVFGGASNYFGGLFGDSHALTWEEPTPVALSLVSAGYAEDRVRLVWQTGGPAGVLATVYRRTATEDWRSLGAISSDGTGRLVFEDRAVLAGTTYSYRLGILEDGREGHFGETSVAVPARLGLSIVALAPGAVPGHLVLRIVVPEAGPARLTLLDLGGRQVLTRDLPAGAGSLELDLGDLGRLPAGVYLARLAQGPRAVVGRAVLIR